MGARIHLLVDEDRGKSYLTLPKTPFEQSYTVGLIQTALYANPDGFFISRQRHYKSATEVKLARSIVYRVTDNKEA